MTERHRAFSDNCNAAIGLQTMLERPSTTAAAPVRLGKTFCSSSRQP